LDVGSLILIPHADLSVAFLAFFCGAGLVAAFCLPARVFEPLALTPAEGLLVGSSLGDQAETKTVRIGMSSSKLGTGEVKLSKACIQTKET
jgi:hypothetical protein